MHLQAISGHCIETMEGTVTLPAHTLMLDFFLLLVISPSFLPFLLVKPTTSAFALPLLPPPSLTCPTNKMTSTLVQLRVVAGVEWVCRIPAKVGFWSTTRLVVELSKDGGPVAVERLLGEARIDLVVVLHLGIDVPLRVVEPLVGGTSKLWHEARTKHRPLWSCQVGEGSPRQVGEGVSPLLRRSRREKSSWKVVPDSWTVVHRVAVAALVHQRSAVLVQRGELVHSEALWGFLVGSLPFGDDWCLVDLARIARAARDRAHLIFHIGAAHTSLQIAQLTTLLIPFV